MDKLGEHFYTKNGSTNKRLTATEWNTVINTVNDLVDSVDNGVTVDLSEYATKEELTTAISEIPAGSQGPLGEQGPQGVRGSDGITPHIDPETKHWMLGEIDTNIVAEGVNGQDGADGLDGQDGQNGHTPVITASKSGSVTTISVDGTAIATISDGQDGLDGVVTGSQALADWNLTNNQSVDYIKNKPTITDEKVGITDESPSLFTPQTSYYPILSKDATTSSKYIDADFFQYIHSNNEVLPIAAIRLGSVDSVKYPDGVNATISLSNWGGYWTSIYPNPSSANVGLELPVTDGTLALTSDIPSLTNYVQKSSTSGLIKNDGTIDTNTYAKIWTGTLAQYDTLANDGMINSTTIYIIS